MSPASSSSGGCGCAVPPDDEQQHHPATSTTAAAKKPSSNPLEQQQSVASAFSAFTSRPAPGGGRQLQPPSRDHRPSSRDPREEEDQGHNLGQEANGGGGGAAKGEEEDKFHHSMSDAYQTYLKHDVQERNHFDDVCQSYRQYATFAMAQWSNHQHRLLQLPEAQRMYLPLALRLGTPEYEGRARDYKDAAIRNQFVLDCILRHAGQPHSQQQQHPMLATPRTMNSPSHNPSDAQMAKVSSVLKSLMRDWSLEGKDERDQAYRPLLDLVQKYVPVTCGEGGASAAPPATTTAAAPRLPPPRLCVPGAGVGRLALELAALGYAVQGNEFSLHMLLASDFVLNGGIATPSKPMRVSPWLLEMRNVHLATDPTRAVEFPDVDPYSLLLATEGNEDRSDGGGESAGSRDNASPDFSMAAGEFVSIYSVPREHGNWHGVVACFFVDNAPCAIEYLKVMYDMLVPGGVLLHFGPLLWHWSGPAMRPDDGSFEDYKERYSHLDAKFLASVDLCWEDLQAVLANIGFELVESRTRQRAHYTTDRRSMMSMEYHCLSFVARKPKASDVEKTTERGII